MKKKLILSCSLIFTILFASVFADEEVSNLPVAKTGTAAAAGAYNSVAVSMAVVGVGLAIGTAVVFSLVHSHFAE